MLKRRVGESGGDEPRKRKKAPLSGVIRESEEGRGRGGRGRAERKSEIENVAAALARSNTTIPLFPIFCLSIALALASLLPRALPPFARDRRHLSAVSNCKIALPRKTTRAPLKKNRRTQTKTMSSSAPPPPQPPPAAATTRPASASPSKRWTGNIDELLENNR